MSEEGGKFFVEWVSSPPQDEIRFSARAYFPFISTLFSILFGKGAHEHSSEFSKTEVRLTFRNQSADDVKFWNVKSLSAYLKHRNNFHEFKYNNLRQHAFTKYVCTEKRNSNCVRRLHTSTTIILTRGSCLRMF